MMLSLVRVVLALLRVAMVVVILTLHQQEFLSVLLLSMHLVVKAAVKVVLVDFILETAAEMVGRKYHMAVAVALVDILEMATLKLVALEALAQQMDSLVVALAAVVLDFKEKEHQV
jgi:hypothetical protein